MHTYFALYILLLKALLHITYNHIKGKEKELPPLSLRKIMALGCLQTVMPIGGLLNMLQITVPQAFTPPFFLVSMHCLMHCKDAKGTTENDNRPCSQTIHAPGDDRTGKQTAIIQS